MNRGRFDAIVVGAGPAGSAAALMMAQNNLSVALLERGDYPGAKNMFGGTIYREPTELIVPEFWSEAPIERTVISEELWFLDQSSAVKMGFSGLQFAQAPYNKFNVFRSDFDRWLAGKAQEAGASLFTKAVVRDFVYEKIGLRKKKIGGVILDEGDHLLADMVVLAEGATGFLALKAGMRGTLQPNAFTLYVKETLSLPKGIIEDRFQLEKDEGAVIGMVGYPASGAIGKGGIWVNRDSLSITVGVYLDQLVNKGLSPYHLLTRMKQHPLVKRLLKGGKSEEYQAHVIPKGGYNNLPKLVDHGIILTGDGAMMISGRRGTDLAMISGKYAGETAAQARAKGEFTSNILAAYETKMNNSFFMEDIQKGKGSLQYFKDHSDADFLINKAMNQAAYEFFKVDMSTGTEKMRKIMDDMKTIQPLFKTVTDVYHGINNWGVL